MNNIPDIVAAIVRSASVALCKMSPEDALDLAAGHMSANARDARRRAGQWSFAATTEQIELALFSGSVADDILSGTVSHPSTGNVRDYALSLLSDSVWNS